MRTKLLLLIFAVALFLRVFNLSTHPAGFHFDEANAGYNAYSIIKTGETLRNGRWPIYLNSFGDFRPMGVVYTMIPSVFVFGLSEFAVRLPMAIFGALSTIILFYLVKRISGDDPVSYLAAAFLAMSPWHINLSRSTGEGVLAIFAALLIFLLYFRILVKPSFKTAILMYLLMCISFVTYHPVNLFLIVFMPVSLIALGLLKRFDRKAIAKVGAIKLLLLVFAVYVIFPFLTGIFAGGATGRFGQVSIKSSVVEHVERELSRVVPQQNDLLVKLFHNKIVDGLLIVSKQYAEYFSPKFLLFEGGPPDRYRIADAGLINVLEFIGIIFLLINLWAFRKNRLVVFFLLWILVAPIASAITTDDQPNVHRTVLMIPAISTLAAFGLVYFFRAIPKKIMYKAVFVMAAVGTLHYFYFFSQYFIHEKYYEGLGRHFVSRDIARELSKVDKSKKVLVATHLLLTDMYVLFFEKIDPKIAQAAYKNVNFERVAFDNYVFTNLDPCVSKLDASNSPVYDVYVDHFYCDTPQVWSVIKLYDPNGDYSVKIVERN